MGVLTALFATLFTQNIQADEPHKSTEIVLVTDATTSISLGAHLQYFEDPEGQLNLHEWLAKKAEFKTSESDTPSFGFTQSAYWVFTELHNSGSRSRSLILELDYPHHDTITLFEKTAGQWSSGTTTGDLFNFEQRPILHHNFLFPISLDAGQRIKIGIRIQSTGSIQVPLTLWDETSFHNFDSTRQLVYGVFFGLLLIMAVYNLFLFFSVRESSYILYVGYVISVTLWSAIYTGFAYRYLWPNNSSWEHDSLPFFMGLLGIFVSLFSISFLELRARFTKMYRLLLACLVTATICCVFAFVLPYAPAIRIGTVASLIVAAVSLFVGLYTWKSGLDQARYYCIAWVAFLLGICLLVLSKFGVIPRVFLTEYGLQLGAAMEVVLLSLALGHRLKLLKEENAIALEAAQESNRLKNEFLANISHELRTPLNAILNVPKILLNRITVRALWRCEECAALFHDTEQDPAQVPETQKLCPDCTAPMNPEKDFISTTTNPEKDHELLQDCYLAARHFNVVIADLLDYTKLEAGKLELSYETVSPDKIVEEVCQTLRHMATEKGIELNFASSSSIPSIEADSIKLSQILFNLLGNAIKFTHQGQVSIDIESRTNGSESLCFTVRDTGMGIPKDAYELIFESFRQVDGSHTRKHGGSGLGLCITQKLVHMHGGIIEVESELGQGSVFRVTLPRKAAPGMIPEQTERLSL